MKLFKNIVASFTVLATVFSLLTSQALATGFYTAGNTGYDISYPQGGNSASYPTTPFNFGVVGVTSGRAFNDNPYLSQQFAWAQQGNAATPSLYMNLNAPVGSTVKGNTSGPQNCKKADKVCQAFNYGWNAAAHSYSYANSQLASSVMWWLDIETGNSWSSTKAINAATINGALSFFTQNGIQAGVYSNSSMWNTIVGTTFTQAVPNWLAGNNTSSNFSTLCNTPFTPNGTVYLLQYASGGFDADYACQ